MGCHNEEGEGIGEGLARLAEMREEKKHLCDEMALWGHRECLPHFLSRRKATGLNQARSN